ncbi:MAG: hypothetical protein R2838_20035 [Caldilineaceae bacterium]
MNIGLRFPVADGKSAIPLTVPDAPFDAVAKADLDAIVAQQPTLPLEINYAPDGSFDGGHSAADGGHDPGAARRRQVDAGQPDQHPGIGP